MYYNISLEKIINILFHSINRTRDLIHTKFALNALLNIDSKNNTWQKSLYTLQRVTQITQILWLNCEIIVFVFVNHIAFVWAPFYWKINFIIVTFGQWVVKK